MRAKAGHSVHTLFPLSECSVISHPLGRVSVRICFGPKRSTKGKRDCTHCHHVRAGSEFAIPEMASGYAVPIKRSSCDAASVR